VSGADAPGYPLYPNPETRLARGAVARLVGTCSGPECLSPIASIDGHDITSLGGSFDLLPGCHLVELRRNVVESNMYVAWTGFMPATLFAMRMSAGHRYIIRREIVQGIGGQGRLTVSALDEDPAGASTPLAPARGAEDIASCQAWTP
jgi:hypothetical protein